MIVAGIGCRPGCPGHEIAALVARAAREAGCRPERLAVPHFRAGEPGPREAAAALSLMLLTVEAEALVAVQGLCLTRSARAEAATGVASVAEGCALAASGGRLRLARIASAHATCAIAEGDGAA